ncbi:C-terminal binding protein [Anaeromicropila populeti]|uniref:D-3-phosphoglycerate dehydrogenase n=1 Tax=Anaeromicropila populeti TaxID=37658 RepID=A0A1I6HMD5_9FIRM|nr:C-terminal binding protein [Anaeromicropila populeti]SFR55558.1 D-3-phosphoglycerate dehydrogenase [Anaeromicropila populeti]
MDKNKVIYYNIDDNLNFENTLLKEWEVEDIELIEIKNQSNEKSFVECVKEADGLVVEYEQITREVIEQLPNLKIVSLQSIGYNNVDLEAATKQGVCVTNSPGFCAEEVALHCIGLAIDLVRKISFYDRSVRRGKWDPLLGYKTYRITGKTFGMVFFGAIPKAMVPVLQSLGLEILVYAPTKSKEYLEGFGCKKAETLDQLLENSDFVSLHCPLMAETTHLIGKNELKKMKESAFLINTARGAVVDETALVEALQTGVIKGAGIDVIEDEVNEKSDLFGLENVVITPHAAFISEDSFYDARVKALSQLVSRLSKKEMPTFIVNKQVKF